MKTIAINYITFGHHHIARLKAIASVFEQQGFEVCGVQLFFKDSSYEWASIDTSLLSFRTATVFDGVSNVIRKSRGLKRGIAQFLNNLKPDVLVITGWGLPETMPALRWRKNNRVPAVLLSDSQERDAKRIFWKEFVKRRRVRLFDAAFVAGKPQARYAIKLGIRQDMVWFGSCVVDNDYFASASNEVESRESELRKQYDLPEKYFLSVSRFIPVKNLIRLIDAYNGYLSQVEDGWKLVLVGDGELMPEVQQHIKRLGLESMVVLPGFKQYADLPVYYGLASCHILASTSETWGLVVNEAMASGLPVLVSRVCGCAEDLVKDGVNGFVFDPFDIRELGRQMSEIASQPERAQAMGQCSQEIIKGFSCLWAARNLWECVRTVLANHQSTQKTT